MIDTDGPHTPVTINTQFRDSMTVRDLATFADTRCLNWEIAFDQPVRPRSHFTALGLIETPGVFPLTRPIIAHGD